MWDALISYFSLVTVEDGIEKAKPILEALQDPKVKLYFLFLSYILPIVVELNLIYQGTEYRLHRLLISIGDKLKMILKNYMIGKHLTETPVGKINPGDTRNFLKIE